MKWANLLWVMLFPVLVACDTPIKSLNSCGDGFVDPGEDCDQADLAGASCGSLGFYKTDGVLACTRDCRFDTTDCDTARCGDGVLQEEQEDCEGADLGGQSCVTLGYSRGELICTGGCSFDLSGCEAGGTCGDGIIQPPEHCDGSDLGGKTCMDLDYYSGDLRCEAQNCQYDLASCEGRCGDGQVDTTFGEECDGTNLAGETCETRGYHPGGTLGCAMDCRSLDETDCATMGRCGDGVVQGLAGEMCDGQNLDQQTCTSQGFESGTLACGTGCDFDTHGCTMNYESAQVGTMIYVPAGTFQRDALGTNLSVVSAFRMSRFEITRAQWVSVTGWADPSDPSLSSGMNDPVQQVSWYDAIAFCNKLSLLEGLTPVYTVAGVDFATLTYAQIPVADDATWNSVTANWSANGYRLPTEMEWMWAAMGADTGNPGAVNTTGHAKAFAGSTGSNAIGDYAVFGYYTQEAGRTTTYASSPVGSKLANELGFHDLSGNATEWAWDWYDGVYPSGTLTDYRGPSPATHRIKRGGSWGNVASDCTVAFRNYNPPTLRTHSIGFRVVRR